MLNPRYTLTGFQKKMAEKEYDNHKKRLADIQKPKKNLSEDANGMMRSTLLVDLHSKHVQFQTSEKINSLDRTNQVLLDKLVKISRNQKPALFKSTNWTGHPGTLNTTYRKKELERIAHENETMAKRLISQQSSVDHKKLKLDFLKHKEFSKNAQKNSYSSPKLSAKLPPLQSPKLEESPKDIRAKNKVKQRISCDSSTPGASKSQTLEKTQESQPVIKTNATEANLKVQPQQVQETKPDTTSRSNQEKVETNTKPSESSRRQSEVNENKPETKEEVPEQAADVSRKASTKTLAESQSQAQSRSQIAKVEENTQEVKEKEEEEEEEKEKKSEDGENKEENANKQVEETKKEEVKAENKEEVSKENGESSNA